jgi:hypothetical protein
VTAEKRQGPRALPIVYECSGCEFEGAAMGIGVSDPYCQHPSLGAKRYKYPETPGYLTPDWCPLMPVRRVIGTCAECAHAVITDRDGLLMCKRVRTLKRGHMFVVRPDFGCIHWEQKP